MVDHKKIIETTAFAIMNLLAKTFPVACSSDEFYYFPHFRSDQLPETSWDDFSPDSINTILQSLTSASADLEKLEIQPKDYDLQTERNVLVHFLQTLQDYLKDHLVWKRQPSFYLTLMNIGLVQAIHSGDQETISQRLKMLPGFLEQAAENLEDIPSPWMEIGLSMIPDCKELIISITGKLPGIESSLKAIDHLEAVMEKRKPAEVYNMPEELLKKIYSHHLATGLTLSEINAVIQDEIDEMWEMMVGEAGRILNKSFKLSHHPGRLIKLVYQRLQNPERSQDHILLLFEDEINRISNHLVDAGILTVEMKRMCPVFIRKMPHYIRAIRSASSYSVDPQHPPRGGTFFVLSHAAPGKPADQMTEYRMLAAHETYPGHHLLDSSRLNLDNIIRRSLEFPVFYEGWACFAEMLLEVMGYFSRPADRFILAKRRFWRAVRGQVDIGLQAGELDFTEAADILRDAGIRQSRAQQVARIYTLNPGYQVCYTVGIRRFLDLFNLYGKKDPVYFVKTVLGEGEVLFGDLDRRLAGIV